MNKSPKPGAVAVVTALNAPRPYRAFYDGEVWRDTESSSFCVVTPTSLRPLVVIDPEDEESIRELLVSFSRHKKVLTQKTFLGPIVDDLNAMQDALRECAAPKPPTCTTKLDVDYGDQGASYRCSLTEGHVEPHCDQVQKISWAAVAVDG